MHLYVRTHDSGLSAVRGILLTHLIAEIGRERRVQKLHVDQLVGAEFLRGLWRRKNIEVINM